MTLLLYYYKKSANLRVVLRLSYPFSTTFLRHECR